MPNTEPYCEEVSRTHPTCLALLIDQSGSMQDPFGGLVEGINNPIKSQGAADALNRCLENIARRCMKAGEVWNYLDIGIWGYGGTVSSVFQSTFGERLLVPLSELYVVARTEERIQKVYDGVGDMVSHPIKFKVWLDAKADGGTPMCQALREVRVAVASWMNSHQSSYPPTIINITDGASTDGDPRSVAHEMMGLTNVNGSKALLFNIHVCDSQVYPVLFPSSTDELQHVQDEYAKMLFEMSSVLPDKLVAEASAGKLPVKTGSRGFVFNAGIADLVAFLDWGTRKPIMMIRDLRPQR